MKTLLFVCLLALPAVAEIPPLPQEQRLQQSSRIVVAKITQVRQLRIDGGKTDSKIIYSVSAQVESVTKGQGLEAGDTIDCTYWKVGERPPGWVGPGGQYEPLVPNSVVKLYLQADNQLLNPNGWDKL